MRTRIVGAIGALAVLLASGAGAEGFVDLYIGGAFTEDERIGSNAAGVGLTPGPSRVTFDDSLVGGLRGGYWIDSAPFLGVALDVSGFAMERDFGASDGGIAVIPLSALLMVRLPLGATDELPQGRIQPYGAVGPGAFVSALGIDIDGLDDFGDATVDAGLDVRAGLNFQILKWLAVFAEYRYTRFDPEWEDSVEGVDVRIDTDLATHHVNVGLGFHF